MLYIENNTFSPYTGYGRFATYITKYMGIDAYPVHSHQFRAGKEIKRQQGIYDDVPVLSILTPMYLKPITNPRILYTMTEGTIVPEWWIDIINQANVSKIIVPCEWNKIAFEVAFPHIPVYVVPGGTEPSEFPIIYETYFKTRPYTFLAFADRGDRKGWIQVWEAFWNEFDENENVKLLIKYRHAGGETTLLDKLSKHDWHDKVQFIDDDFDNMHDLYKMVDCVCIPSHSEGWGMIMREAACSGIPTITTKYSGMDDGSIEQWAYPIYEYIEVDVPFDENLAGKCALPNVKAIQCEMREVFSNKYKAKDWACYNAAEWIRYNQTWEHTVSKLGQVIYD